MITRAGAFSQSIPDESAVAAAGADFMVSSVAASSFSTSALTQMECYPKPQKAEFQMAVIH